MKQRLIYLPILALAVLTFGLFWWLLASKAFDQGPYEIIFIPRLIFSYLLHVGVVGLLSGAAVRPVSILAVKIHAILLGPILMLEWTNLLWLATFWTASDSVSDHQFDTTRLYLSLAIWFVAAAWTLGRTAFDSFRDLPSTLYVTVKIVSLALLPAVTVFFIAAMPVLLIAAGDR